MVRSALESHPHILCHNEVFHETRQAAYRTMAMEEVLKNMVWQHMELPMQAVGFLLMRYQCQISSPFAPVWDILAHMTGLKVIMLSRKNIVDRAVSLAIAQKFNSYNDQHRLAMRDDPVIELSVDDFLKSVNAYTKHMVYANLKLGRQKLQRYWYEDILDDPIKTYRSMQQFLGVKEVLDLAATTRRVEKRSLQDVVINYAELKEASEQTIFEDHFKA